MTKEEPEKGQAQTFYMVVWLNQKTEQQGFYQPELRVLADKRKKRLVKQHKELEFAVIRSDRFAGGDKYRNRRV